MESDIVDKQDKKYNKTTASDSNMKEKPENAT